MPRELNRDTAPITIITPIRGFWRQWLLATWPGADRWPVERTWIKRPLLALNFIHVAHWALFTRLPARAPRPRATRLPTPYILFQSNYDGPAEEYIETFAFRVAWRIYGLWWGGYQFPGTRRSQKFVDFVLERGIELKDGHPYHYYAAYPAGTVRTVASALELRRRFEEFDARAAQLGPNALADEWARFLSREQERL
jgi:hypothetical protein